MVRRRVLAVAAVLVLLVFDAPASGDASAGSRPAGPERASPYAVVTLSSPPAASYEGTIPGLSRTKPERGRLDSSSPAYQAYRDHLEQEHASYRRYLARHAPAARVVREYYTVLNGIAVELNGTRLATLRNGPGVRQAVPSVTYRPAMNVSNDLIRAPEVWDDLGGQPTAGEGVRVAVVDSGIDLSNRFFGDDGLPAVAQVDACPDKDGDPATADTNNKVPVCRVYASGISPGASAPAVTLAMDHGTHVAGTIAGRSGTTGTVAGTDVEVGGLSGVAPGALLGDYNVFPGFGAGWTAFGGSAFSHDIAAALEDAVLDGMHVVNMSLGGAVQGVHDVLAEASDATVDAGLVVAVAAGNSGPGDATVDSPGSADKVVTAAATSNPHFVGIEVTPAGGPTVGAALGDFAQFGNVTAPYTVTSPANGCTAIAGDLAGKIALIDRGACTFTTKIRNAQAAGAAGVLVANNVAGDPVAMAHDGSDPFPTIPAAMVGKSEGGAMKPSGTVTVDGTSPAEIFSLNADVLAGFSSRGPTPFRYTIKPDVAAPGVNVLSSVFGDEFAFFQGTSMATPHVAGAAALLLDLHPGAMPAQVKSRLVNSAARVVTDHVTGTNDPGVLARGGGRLDLVEAAEAATFFDPVSVSFGLLQGNRPVHLTRVVALTGEPAVDATVQPTAPLPPGLEVTASLGEGVLTVGLDVHGAVPAGDYSGDVAVTSAAGDVYLVPFWVRLANR